MMTTFKRYGYLLACAAIGMPMNASAQEPLQSSLHKAAYSTATPAKDLYPKDPTETPSGFRVPRYVSLKYGEINGRSGPSESHPVQWRYQRRGLPVIIIAETDNWRKIRDKNGDESWMHKRTLDGRRMVVTQQDVVLRAKPRESSKGKAIAAIESVLELQGCDDLGWCEVHADTGHRGYVEIKTIWGAAPL